MGGAITMERLEELLLTLFNYQYPEPNDDQIKMRDDILSAIIHLKSDNGRSKDVPTDLLGKIKDVLLSGVQLYDAKNSKDLLMIANLGLKFLSAAAFVASFVLTVSGVGAAAATALNVIGKVTSEIAAFFNPQQESLVSQIREIIVNELKNYEYNEVTKRRVHGWCQVEKSIISQLQFHHQSLINEGDISNYKRFDPQRLDQGLEIMGELICLANEQFDELAEERKDSKKKTAEKCLACIGGYSSIASYYIMILSWHQMLASQHYLLAYQREEFFDMNNPQILVFRNDIKLLEAQIEKAKNDAREFLGFLSDEDMLGPAGWWVGKLQVMKEYRETPKVFARVESFRALVGCSPTEYTVSVAEVQLNACIKSDLEKLAPSFRLEFGLVPADNDYLLIVNSTRWPVCVFSGLVGRYKNEFKMEVEPHSHAVHPATERKKYSACGIITVGENMKELCHMKDIQYIEYGISNIWKWKIHTNPVDIFSEKHLKKAYNDGLKSHKDDPKRFDYHGQMCMVQGIMLKNEKFCVSSICIEEFDEEDLKRSTNKLELNVNKCTK
jgi:hypothetical protein